MEIWYFLGILWRTVFAILTRNWSASRSVSNYVSGLSDVGTFVIGTRSFSNPNSFSSAIVFG